MTQHRSETALQPTYEQGAVKAAALTLCRSRKFETGQGTCAALCMDQLGDPRRTGCCHVEEVHGKLAQEVVAAVISVLSSNDGPTARLPARKETSMAAVQLTEEELDTVDGWCGSLPSKYDCDYDVVLLANLAEKLMAALVQVATGTTGEADCADAEIMRQIALESLGVLGCRLKSRPWLKALLEKAKSHVMTPEEIQAQRESWRRAFAPCPHGMVDFEECPKCLAQAAKK